MQPRPAHRLAWLGPDGLPCTRPPCSPHPAKQALYVPLPHTCWLLPLGLCASSFLCREHTAPCPSICGDPSLPAMVTAYYCNTSPLSCSPCTPHKLFYCLSPPPGCKLMRAGTMSALCTGLKLCRTCRRIQYLFSE